MRCCLWVSLFLVTLIDVLQPHTYAVLSSVSRQLSEVTLRFEGHKREQEDLEQRLKDLAKEVTSNIPGDKYAKFLLRVYRKKIKIKSDAKKDGEMLSGTLWVRSRSMGVVL